MAIATINPANGETLKTFTPLTAEEIEGKLAQAQSAFVSYRKTKMSDRAQWLHNAADLLDKNAEEYGKIMTLEMGKTLKSAIAEAKKCALVCRYYADNAADFLKDIPGESDGSSAFVRYQPLGIVLAVMPWNFPSGKCFALPHPL
jgi:succinate-semialdehyde dehydrogenase/glutarate-semialdehyde dehydrogenase